MLKKVIKAYLGKKNSFPKDWYYLLSKDNNSNVCIVFDCFIS